MCGIVGATGSHGQWIYGAVACLRHRGPDRRSVHIASGCELGHARLAIIDLSPDADQPMLSGDGSLALVFNGEFYNFKARRAELERCGHRFGSRSDTEVVLKLFEVYGDKALEYMNGQFALAVWDSDRQRLLLARDRIGEKPLYFAQLPNGHLAFASEIKALLQLPSVSREIDSSALDDYLTYLYIPADRTIFRDIRKLEPGECLTWEGGRAQCRRYWELPPPAPWHGSPEELQYTISEHLSRSVRDTLVADVPIGVLLSGGIDSSSIVATASGLSARLKTFTVVFDRDGARYDERGPAKRVSQHFATEHHELQVSGESTELLPAVVRSFDQPFGNPTALLTYEIARQMRQHVTVAIGGDGGDEVFGGYPRYQGILLSQKYRRVPASIRRAIARGARTLPESRSGRHALRRLKEFATGNTLDPDEMYTSWVTYFDPSMRRCLYTPAMRKRVGTRKAEAFLQSVLTPPSSPLLDRAIRADLRSFLPSNVLEYGDKMSMAHGLELRLPMLDVELVSLLSSLPASLKLSNGRPKHLLKQVMRNRLPGWVLRRRKVGFNPPMGVWIDQALRERLDDYLGPAQVIKRGYFNPEIIAGMRSAHRLGRRDFSLHLWSLLVLEEWHRQYAD